ncbi:unnamed protein product [Ceratitis capitata]|uniref:(Mediterranean fruit fly) hypothetical protein n=1 Tax=Ceratitis capitata TaxID=7213 RepID=A0A811UG73_CERCA|nr:unnamed protein product [Ceratitis capitata]
MIDVDELMDHSLTVSQTVTTNGLIADYSTLGVYCLVALNAIFRRGATCRVITVDYHKRKTNTKRIILYYINTRGKKAL